MPWQRLLFAFANISNPCWYNYETRLLSVGQNNRKAISSSILKPYTSVVPLILTLRLDDRSFRFFNELRRRHFPPERNYLEAHLTLFHHLPDTLEISGALKTVAAEITEPMPLQVTGLQSLGGGVAYTIVSAALQQLHSRLQQQWQPLLTPQDRQKRRPHITVQNKTTPQEAASLLRQLSEGFAPFTAWGHGLDLWAYLNGPWAHNTYFPFQGA